jgi:hypothetical protein
MNGWNRKTTISSKPRCFMCGVITIGLSIDRSATLQPITQEKAHVSNLYLRYGHIVVYVGCTPGATIWLQSRKLRK